MNAQEAIKLAEQALIDTKEEVNEYLNDPFVPEKDKNIMRNDLKAQEIVLDLAKKEDKAETRLYDISSCMEEYFATNFLNEEAVIEFVNEQLTEFYDEKGAVE